MSRLKATKFGGIFSAQSYFYTLLQLDYPLFRMQCNQDAVLSENFRKVDLRRRGPYPIVSTIFTELKEQPP